jgi:hypothetical protein
MALESAIDASRQRCARVVGVRKRLQQFAFRLAVARKSE